MGPGSLPPSSAASVEERILLLAATEDRNAGYTEVLRSSQLHVESFTSLPDLIDALQNGAGTLMVEEDAISREGVRLLSTAMSQREPWSNLPIVILTSGDPEAIQRLQELDLFGPATASNITILERPVHEVTLTTVVRTSLRARRRQYEIRDLMEDLRSMNEKLRESQVELESINETLEERVEARTEQTRRLTLALTTAEQRERARVSQLLHDQVQQLLHGARIWAETLAEEKDESPPDALERLQGLLGEAIEAVRSLSVDISPPVLREEGLAAALEWLQGHVEKTHDLTLELEVPRTLMVPAEDLRTLLFRSVRELVFNVVKHAKVDTASIRAAETDGSYVIEVEDEGTGFDPESLEDNGDLDEHFGLFSIRERLDLVGGTLTIDSAPGNGTRARIDAPASK